MLSVISTHLGKNKVRLGLIAVVAFVAYCFFPFMTTTQHLVRFNSPDETANWTTANRVANGDGVAIYEPLNLEASNIIHPRSMTVLGDRIVPISFLAMPVLYGVIGLLSSPFVLPYLTAIFTTLGILAAYQVWKYYWGEKISLMATLLWAFHPAVWYYASRGFYHNMLFVDLLLIAWWVYIIGRSKNWPVDWLISFVLIVCVAISVRLNEIIWILPILCAAYWINRKELKWQQHVLVIAVFAIFWSAYFWLQSQILNGGLTGAYVVPQGEQANQLRQLMYLFLPFGFDIKTLGQSVESYLVVMFAPLWTVAWIGVIWNWQKIKDIYSERGRQLFYIAITIFITLWLILYYGSWGVIDTVGPSGATLGNSHVRYWLPIFALTMPLIASGILVIRSWLDKSHARLVVSAVILVLIGYSFVVTYFDRYEGLVDIANRLSYNRTTAEFVQNITTKDTIILGDRIDKIFFPERRVITPGDRPFYTYQEVLTGVSVILDTTPVYVYSRGLLDVNAAVEFAERGIVASQPIALPDGGWLYNLTKL